MRRVVPVALALVLAACTPQPTVPDAMLAEVSAETLQRLEPRVAEAEQLELEIAATTRALAAATRDEAEQQQRLEAAREALAAERQLKQLAVGRGDASAAEQAELRLRRAADLVDEVEAELERATDERIRLQARLELLEAEHALVLAEIERLRARAVAAEVQDFDVVPFERAVRAAAERRDRVAREAEKAGATPPEE